jgi:hypothetical protein
MRTLITSSILSTAALAGGLAAAPAQAALVITEVAPQSTAGTASTINGDWWELSNSGSIAIDLAGYQWADTEDKLPGTDSNFFPSFLLAPGQSVVILEEGSANKAAWRTNWGISDSVVIFSLDDMVDDSTPDGDTFSGLGNSNDGVFIYSAAGTLLDSYLYVANTRGVSFEKSLAGVDLGLSVVGENGAVRAVNGDIGSPGFAVVPVPAAAWLLGSALAAVAGLRRRAAR